ncbi:MAG: HAD family hydrolase, partial [Actinomycetota bacterium]|nr:HAD family hydrolase [Actinomycetota bacterium]
VAAKAAKLACVVVVNDYTRDQDFADSELVLDGFGGDGSVGVLGDPYQLAPETRLDVATLRRVAGRRDDRS